MNMVLRPGEAITWQWGHADPVKYHGENKPRYPDMICNGLWEYRPDFSVDLWKKGATAIEDIELSRGELTAAEEKTGTVVWIVRSPYVLVGGRLEVEGSGAKFSLSWDGNLDGSRADWESSSRLTDRHVTNTSLHASWSAEFSSQAVGHRQRSQMAPLALPRCRSATTICLHRSVSAERRCESRTAGRAVRLPPAGSSNGANVPNRWRRGDGADLVFRWRPPGIPTATRLPITILNYRSAGHEVACPELYKLISNTADRGKAQYTSHGQACWLLIEILLANSGQG